MRARREGHHLASLSSPHARSVGCGDRILDTRLADHEYLAGGYSIADIAAWPWVRIHPFAGVEVDGLPHLQRWLDAVAARPAVERGVGVPGSLPEDARRDWLERARRAA